jgi:hypothetical protein
MTAGQKHVVATMLISIGLRAFQADHQLGSDLHSSHSFTDLMLKASHDSVEGANLACLKIKHMNGKSIPILIGRAQ